MKRNLTKPPVLTKAQLLDATYADNTKTSFDEGLEAIATAQRDADTVWYEEDIAKITLQTKVDLRSKVIDFIQGQYIVKTGDKYRLNHDDLLNLNALFDVDNHHVTESAPHFHNWEDGTYYSHSHKGGNVPHGHHGCRYGMPKLPKITKQDLEIKRDGVFDD